MDEKSMRAAIELHRPIWYGQWANVIWYDRWANVTSDPAMVSEKYEARCQACRGNVGSEGCQTWKVANP